MKTILVTGAAGLIGSEVCRALLTAGNGVVAVWTRTAPSAQHDRLKWVRQDLAIAEAWGHVPEVDAIIHCAATLPATFADSTAAAAANRRVDANLLRFARERRLPLVYASSASVYGTRREAEATLSETSGTRPSGDYAREKTWAEQEGLRLMERSAVPFTALRISAPYGVAQTRKTVMSIFIERALNHQRLLYHGTGMREQDFIYASDAAAAFVASIGRPAGIINVASGEPVTMRQLGMQVAEATNLLPAMVQPSGQDDPQEGVTARFSIGRARDQLGWQPTIPLKEGISRCVAVRRRLTGCA